MNSPLVLTRSKSCPAIMRSPVSPMYIDTTKYRYRKILNLHPHFEPTITRPPDLVTMDDKIKYNLEQLNSPIFGKVACRESSGANTEFGTVGVNGYIDPTGVIVGIGNSFSKKDQDIIQKNNYTSVCFLVKFNGIFTGEFYLERLDFMSIPTRRLFLKNKKDITFLLQSTIIERNKQIEQKLKK